MLQPIIYDNTFIDFTLTDESAIRLITSRYLTDNELGTAYSHINRNFYRDTNNVKKFGIEQLTEDFVSKFIAQLNRLYGVSVTVHRISIYDKSAVSMLF